MPREARLALWLLALLLPLCPPSAAAEKRLVQDADSPAWLGAVGQLRVPGVRYEGGYGQHRREDCSATLVAAGAARRADILVTAWHCLEDYRDLSKPITFTLSGPGGEQISREAYRVADGGGMYADWAVLKLYRPIDSASVQALRVHPRRADPALPVTMAGYSRDRGLGAGGKVLTYHADCRITHQSADAAQSDCQAFKGASGGAVIQYDGDGRALLCGVVSRGDSSALSIFVPVEEFRGALNRQLVRD